MTSGVLGARDRMNDVPPGGRRHCASARPNAPCFEPIQDAPNPRLEVRELTPRVKAIGEEPAMGFGEVDRGGKIPTHKRLFHQGSQELALSLQLGRLG